MLNRFCPIPQCLTTHLSYYRFLLMKLLVAKTKSNQSQGREATLFKGPTVLPRVWVPVGGLVLDEA